MLTASSERETIRRCEELGAVYVQKGPQLWDELSVAMRRIFETSKANDEKFGVTDVARAPEDPPRGRRRRHFEWIKIATRQIRHRGCYGIERNAGILDGA